MIHRYKRRTDILHDADALGFELRKFKRVTLKPTQWNLSGNRQSNPK
jgi:hypothetical protein